MTTIDTIAHALRGRFPGLDDAVITQQAQQIAAMETSDYTAYYAREAQKQATRQAVDTAWRASALETVHTRCDPDRQLRGAVEETSERWRSAAERRLLLVEQLATERKRRPTKATEIPGWLASVHSLENDLTALDADLVTLEAGHQMAEAAYTQACTQAVIALARESADGVTALKERQAAQLAAALDDEGRWRGLRRQVEAGRLLA